MKYLRNLKLTGLISIFPQLFYPQNGVSFEEVEDYNWSEFDAELFITAGLICSGLILGGMFIQKQNESENKLIKFISILMIIAGGIGALLFILPPILGAISMLIKVGTAILIVYGVIQFFLMVTSEEDGKKGE